MISMLTMALKKVRQLVLSRTLLNTQFIGEGEDSGDGNETEDDHIWDEMKHDDEETVALEGQLMN